MKRKLTLVGSICLVLVLVALSFGCAKPAPAPAPAPAPVAPVESEPTEPAPVAPAESEPTEPAPVAPAESEPTEPAPENPPVEPPPEEEKVAEPSIGEVRYTLTVNVNPEEWGNVMVLGPDHSIGPIQPEGYLAGSKLTLIAASSTDYAFDSWSGDVSGAKPNIIITMDSDKSVTASFKEKGEEVDWEKECEG